MQKLQGTSTTILDLGAKNTGQFKKKLFRDEIQSKGNMFNIKTHIATLCGSPYLANIQYSFISS